MHQKKKNLKKTEKGGNEKIFPTKTAVDPNAVRSQLCRAVSLWLLGWLFSAKTTSGVHA